jgi:predicted O-methyltransferase YrrM
MAYPNWFAPYAMPLFEKYLMPLAEKPGLRFLQVGAFTGDATLWMLNNVLTADGSTLVDVDTWTGSDEPEHDRFNWSDVSRVYLSRTDDYRRYGRLLVHVGSSESYFKSTSERFDFIYIDGAHDRKTVFHDGLNALKFLRPGGLLAFDDLQWRSGKGPEYEPYEAIQALSLGHLDELEILELSAQAWFRKS